MALRAVAGSSGGSGTIGGSIAATQVAFGSGANTITGSANFTYDGTGLTITSGSLVASDPGMVINQTWNNAVAFTAMKINVTNTASAAGSLLQDWQVGGVSKAAVNLAGGFNASAGQLANGFGYAIGGTGGSGLYSSSGSNLFVAISGMGQFGFNLQNFQLQAAGGVISFGNLGSTQTSGLAQNAAGVVEVNNGTAGTFAALKLSTLTATTAAPTVSAGQIGYGGTTSATATAGASITIPALAQGYIVVNIAGTTAKIPYYNN